MKNEYVGMTWIEDDEDPGWQCDRCQNVLLLGNPDFHLCWDIDTDGEIFSVFYEAWMKSRGFW